MKKLAFTKTWQDEVESFGEIECAVSGNEISAKFRFYTTDEALESLSQKLISFSKFEWEKCEWESFGNNTLNGLGIRLFFLDNALHIRAEILARVDNEESHTCCFFIDGLELGSLEIFAKNLKNIGVGETVSIF